MSTATERPPYEAYAAIMGAFAGGLGVAGVAARVLGRDPQCQTFLDLTVLSSASFKAARTLSGDEVTSFLREPFARDMRTRETRSRSKAAISARRSGSSSRAAPASVRGRLPGSQ